MRQKIKSMVAVVMMVADLIAMPSEQLQFACSSLETDRGRIPSYVVASSIAFGGLRKCMGASFHAMPANRALPSAILAEAWPLGQGIEASFSMSQEAGSNQSDQNLAQRELSAELNGLGLYWDPSSTPAGYFSTIATVFNAPGAKYYDDNAWLGILMLELYKSSKQTWMLNRAVEIMTLNLHGTEGTSAYPKPGGVFWTQEPGNHYRATVSTAGSVQLALELYQLTKKPEYLTFAITEFNWVNQYLKGPQGLYHDGLNPDGSISPVYYSYNQGLMVTDGALLFAATGDLHYLANAEALADAALAYFSTGRLGDEEPIFLAIFFKDLIILEEVGGHSNYRQVMESYADLLWSDLNSMGMLVHKGGISWLSQAATVQVFADLVTPSAVFLP